MKRPEGEEAETDGDVNATNQRAAMVARLECARVADGASRRPIGGRTMLRFSVLNESTVASDAEVRAMRPALETQWSRDPERVWRYERATFTRAALPHARRRGSGWLVFLDDSDQARTLACHDLTDEGLPISKVFVKTVITDKASLGVAASHELREMAVDPWLVSAGQDPNGAFSAGEVCATGSRTTATATAALERW